MSCLITGLLCVIASVCLSIWAVYSDPIINNDGVGYVDFAGSGVIHITGAASSLAAILVVGPRLGRYTGNAKDLLPHSTTVYLR